MKKTILALVLVIIVITLSVLTVSLTLFIIKEKPIENKSVKVIFKTSQGDVRITTEIADTPEERARGLMWREELGELEGMLFIFDDEALRGFWMKNTLIYLDIIYVSEDLRIVSIQKNAEPCKEAVCRTYTSEYPARYVIEVNGGFSDKYGIEIGDEVLILNI